VLITGLKCSLNYSQILVKLIAVYIKQCLAIIHVVELNFCLVYSAKFHCALRCHGNDVLNVLRYVSATIS